jgi:hypothetical protein
LTCTTGPFVDEQPGQRRGLGQRAAAVAAQIDDQPVDAVALQVLDELAHVARGAGEVAVALGLGAEVAVEGGHLDDADAR